MKNNKGFTLVEVLAVITILGIVVILALPASLDAIGKSRKKLNEYTKKNIEDSARMYFTDIVEKTDPDNIHYNLAPGETFKSVITDRVYCKPVDSSKTCPEGSLDYIFGYDFIIYALLKSGNASDFTENVEVITIKDEFEDVDDVVFYAATANSKQFSYGGTQYFVDLNNEPINDSYISRGHLTVSLYDMVSHKYYNSECVYKGMSIKGVDNEGNTSNKIAEEKDEHGCTLERTCRVELTLKVKVNKESGLLEVVEYDMSVPDVYNLDESTFKEYSMDPLVDLNSATKGENDKYLWYNQCAIVNKK